MRFISFLVRKLSLGLILIGVALLIAALGQYGFMSWRQHELRRQWNGINQPAARHRSPADQDLRLRIAGIHLDDAVVRGTSYEDLLVAPGLLAGSPLPAQGGNTVIAGHRDTFFRRISDLKLGDTIELQSRGRDFIYRVSHREIVPPTEISVLAPTASPRLTLITCYPTYWIGPAPDRLVVEATRVAIH